MGTATGCSFADPAKRLLARQAAGGYKRNAVTTFPVAPRDSSEPTMTQPHSSPGHKGEYPKYEPGETVALFIPCYIDQFFPEIGEATAKLLTKYGVPLAYPEEQTCCGQPAFNSGYWEEARGVIHQFCKGLRILQVDRFPFGFLHGHVPRVLRARRPGRADRGYRTARVRTDGVSRRNSRRHRHGRSLPREGYHAQRLPRPARTGDLQSAADAAAEPFATSTTGNCRTSRSAAASAARSA